MRTELKQLHQDEKVCPFCAEVIKAAAIRCRYCGSDLAPVDPPEPEAVSPELPTDEAQSTDEVEPAAPRPWPRWLVPGLAVSLLVMLVFVGLALYEWRQASELHDADEAGDHVRATVPAQVEALLSYKYTSFDKDLEAATTSLTDEFREEYEPTVDALRTSATDQKLSQTADVVASSVISESPDRVEALLFVNTTSTKEGETQSRLMNNRIKVDVVKVGDSWLIDDITFPQS